MHTLTAPSKVAQRSVHGSLYDDPSRLDFDDVFEQLRGDEHPRRGEWVWPGKLHGVINCPEQ